MNEVFLDQQIFYEYDKLTKLELHPINKMILQQIHYVEKNEVRICQYFFDTVVHLFLFVTYTFYLPIRKF